MRIAFVITSLSIGGAETSLVRLANSLAMEQGHQVLLISLDYGHRRDLQVNVNPLVQLRFLPFSARAYRKSTCICTSPFVSWALKWILIRFKPDVINSHLFHSDVLVSRVGEKLAPTVITDHGDYKNSQLSLETRVRVLKNADQVISASHYTRDFLKQSFGLVSHLVLFGYERPVYLQKTRADFGLPEDRFLYLLVARGIPEKGWCEAVEAFHLLNQGEDAGLVFVGSGPGVDKALVRAKELGVQGLFALGALTEPQAAMQLCDTLVLPSYFESETFGLVLIEAVFENCPVIATRWGGLPRVVENEGDPIGILSDMNKEGRPDVKSLAEAMRAMRLRAGEFPQSLSRAQVRYSQARWVQETLRVFEQAKDQRIQSVVSRHQS